MKKVEIKTATIPYVPEFLTRAEADDLFRFCQTLTPVRSLNPRNQKSYIRKVSYGCYSVLSESRTGKSLQLATAPDQIKFLAGKITEYAGVEINYLSLLGYESEKDHIGFHNHSEDLTLVSQAVYVASFGQVRRLTTRPVGSKDRTQYEQLDPVHGSLYVLPSEYNTTHEHAILDSNVPCGLRISINCKHIDDAYLLQHQPKPEAEPFVRVPGPPRIYCKRKGFTYPADAVDVTKGTPYGNYKKFQDKDHIEEVIRQMQDPEFAAKVEALRGKDLLCWCEPGNPRCHAWPYLVLANAETL